MSREIKFRAWDTATKKFVEPFTLVNIELNGTIIVIDWNKGGERMIRTDVILCQFTGLKDKNGKEIYEGDVVKYTTGEVSSNLDGIKPIEFRAGSFCVGSMEQGWKVGDGRLSIEVIGNIYENPELLTN